MFYIDIHLGEGASIALPLIINEIHYLNQNNNEKLMITFPLYDNDIDAKVKMSLIRIFCLESSSLQALKECHVTGSLLKSGAIYASRPNQYLASGEDKYVAFVNKRPITKAWIETTNRRRITKGLHKTQLSVGSRKGIFYIPMISKSNNRSFSLNIDTIEGDSIALGEVSSYGLSRIGDRQELLTFLPVFK